MTYYSKTQLELAPPGIREGELAIFTSTMNPKRPHTLSSNTESHGAYCYLWEGGEPKNLAADFQNDGAGLDVLEVLRGEEEYTFLRDKTSGYIQQVAGPVKPITVSNLGAFPLRVDTLLGKFIVYPGTALRLDESTPQREKKKILLTVGTGFVQPLKSAELWDGSSWQRLNILEEQDVHNVEHRLTVLDGIAIVQYMKWEVGRRIFMADPPERDPDFEIYVTGQIGSIVTLLFNRTDYCQGQVVQRKRTISFSRWGAPVIYDLQKLKDSKTQALADQCTVELSDLQVNRESYSAPDRPLLTSGEHGLGTQRKEQRNDAGPTPEPPENFPE